jgi:hypothetical protein
LPLQLIYNRGNWKRLCQEAEQIVNYSSQYEKEIHRAISKKWLSCCSTSYFQFILTLAQKNFVVSLDKLSDEEKTMSLMIHYDVWQGRNGFYSIKESLESIGRNKVLVSEIIEVLEILLDKIDFLEKDIVLPYSQPLKLHSRYTREQIFAAFGMSTFESKTSNREGVAILNSLNTELLFVDLIKSEKDFSPSTLYQDYALSDRLFHWQTQNSARPDQGRGLSYIKQEELGKIILLFVRERNEDEFKNTMSYVFLGEAKFIDYYGSKPMNITWELFEPMPHYLWKDSAKMAIG